MADANLPDRSRLLPAPGLATVFVSGVATSVQVGKAVVSGPRLQEDLGLSLGALGWLISMIAAVSLVGGLQTGLSVRRLGARRLLAGLAATTAGSAIGALSSGFALLALSRMIEGLGFLLVTVSAPAILHRTLSGKALDTALSFWACFMPLGTAVALALAPLFDDWRTVWWAAASLPALMLFPACICLRVDEPDPDLPRSLRSGNVRRTLAARTAVILAAVFALYSLMFFALFSFLPSLIVETMGVSLRQAGGLSALAAARTLSATSQPDPFWQEAMTG